MKAKRETMLLSVVSKKGFFAASNLKVRGANPLPVTNQLKGLQHRL
jgi:hypothetical protein